MLIVADLWDVLFGVAVAMMCDQTAPPRLRYPARISLCDTIAFCV